MHGVAPLIIRKEETTVQSDPSWYLFIHLLRLVQSINKLHDNKLAWIHDTLSISITSFLGANMKEKLNYKGGVAGHQI
jgi:hypothetical protein